MDGSSLTSVAFVTERIKVKGGFPARLYFMWVWMSITPGPMFSPVFNTSGRFLIFTVGGHGGGGPNGAMGEGRKTKHFPRERGHIQKRSSLAPFISKPITGKTNSRIWRNPCKISFHNFSDWAYPLKFICSNRTHHGRLDIGI